MQKKLAVSRQISSVVSNNFSLPFVFYFKRMKSFFLGHRVKTPSTSNLNTSQIMNSSVDQSRDNSASKRFARKQGHHLETTKACKTPKTIDLKIKKHMEERKLAAQTKKTHYMSSGFIKQEDLYLKISNTPSKGALYSPLISTDRATESTILSKKLGKEQNNNEPDPLTVKKRNYNDIQDELELKIGEVMMLEDQNLKLKGEISRLQSEHLKMSLKKQKQYQLTVKQLNQEIQHLKSQLTEKNQFLKKANKVEVNLSRELKGVKYDKLMLQKQIQEIYKKRLTKELRDLMSYRELSLSRQVQELRQELQRQKTDKQKLMEAEISKLKKNNNEKDSSLKKMQVQSHVMNKKLSDVEEEVKFQQEQFSKCFSNLQLTNTSLIDQLKRTRKQNLKLQRLNMLTSQNKRKVSMATSDESDTLTISLSPRSPRDL